jgi:transcriptional regulator with XRE-family HTH domain
LPSEEEEICVRVRSVRLAASMSQAAFGDLIGLTRDRLASYEYARAPIRWGVGHRICSAFLLSQRWLAEGKLPVGGFYEQLPRFDVEEDELFSAGYRKISGAFLRFFNSATFLATGTREERARIAREFALENIAADLSAIPDEFLDDYRERLSSFSKVLVQSFDPAPPAPPPTKESSRAMIDEFAKGNADRARRSAKAMERSREVHARLLLTMPPRATQ